MVIFVFLLMVEFVLVGREILLEAEEDRVYLDRDTGEELEVIGKVLPVPPSNSSLPWSVENLRFCNWCDQLTERDLNDCRRYFPSRTANGDLHAGGSTRGGRRLYDPVGFVELRRQSEPVRQSAL